MSQNTMTSVQFFMPTRNGGQFPHAFAEVTEGEGFLIDLMATTGMTVSQAVLTLRPNVPCRKVLAEIKKAGYGDSPLENCIRH